ncbi:MAG: spore cortex biosynthesis protein YabQ [Faecalibacillus sp.]
MTQLQGVGYSFVFGMVFTFLYHFINYYIFKIKYHLFRFIMQIIFGILFAGYYFIGLLVINDGILRAYFICALIMGYIFYQNVFSEKLYSVILYIDGIVKFVFKPVRIAIYKINGIICKTKKVIRWRKKESKKQLDQ